MTNTACVMSSACCALAVCRSATEWTRAMCRCTSAAKASSEPFWANCSSNRASGTSVIHQLYVRRQRNLTGYFHSFGRLTVSSLIGCPSEAKTVLRVFNGDQCDAGLLVERRGLGLAILVDFQLRVHILGAFHCHPQLQVEPDITGNF